MITIPLNLLENAPKLDGLQIRLTGKPIPAGRLMASGQDETLIQTNRGFVFAEAGYLHGVAVILTRTVRNKDSGLETLTGVALSRSVTGPPPPPSTAAGASSVS